MSLTNRFSALLLITLGLTLIGFSGALLVLSRVYLDRRLDDRLATTLTLLNSSADTKHGWVRWDAREKRLPPSIWQGRDATTWLVFDTAGRVLTHPRHLPQRELTAEWSPRPGAEPFPPRVVDRGGRRWRVAWRRILAGELRDPRPTDTSEGKSYHEQLVLAAFGSYEEIDSTLTLLGWLLAGISALIWAIAALCARWLSRKTLVPLTRLVDSVRSLDPSRPGWELSEVGTRDELDDLRRAFNDLLNRLREAYDRQRRFSSEASHQLRTPVAIMIGHLEVALRHDRSREEYRRVIQLAHRRAADLGQIVESFLFLSRADSATLTRPEPMELGPWLVAHMAHRPANERSADLAVDATRGSGLWIRAQPLLLAQMVENLLDNACKYSRPSTLVLVAVRPEGESAVLSVEDSGCGITAEDLPHVFEPFFRSQTPSGERIPGFGLGLAVVRGIAAAFGGTASVASELGRGSRCEVRLPRMDRPADDEPGSATKIPLSLPADAACPLAAARE
jgi:signal transduction histidine kinase